MPGPDWWCILDSWALMIHCWALYRPKLSVHSASGYSAASTDTLSSKIDSFALKTLLCLVLFIFHFNPLPAVSHLFSALLASRWKKNTKCAFRSRRATMWKKKKEGGKVKWRRKGKKDHALMRRIRAIEHDRTRRRPASEIRSEVWFATEGFECFLSTLQSVGATLENRSVPGCEERSEWGGGSFTSDEDGTLQTT